MTFIPIEMNISQVVWNEILQRYFIIISGKKWSDCNLTDGDQLSLTDESKEYEILLEVKSISRKNTVGIT